MFGIFGPKGWDALPRELLSEVRARLKEDFYQLDALAKTHNLFKQPFFKRPPRDFLSPQVEADMLAFLVGSLGSQLDLHGRTDDARTALGLSLKLKPTANPASFSIASLLAGEGDLDAAVSAAHLALETLWSDEAMRLSDDGRKMHVSMARILTEDELRRVLGEELLDLARQGLELYEGSWTDEQRNRVVYASLAFGGPDHDMAIAEVIDATGDFWFDAAMWLTAQQFGRSSAALSGSGSMLDEARKVEAVYSRLVPLAIACTRLKPNHFDPWVLAAKVRSVGAEAGLGHESQAFDFALEALERIEHLLPDDVILAIRDGPASAGADAAHSMMAEILERFRSAATAEQLDRAAPFLT